ncbi:hypothetical protein LTR05_004526 [Lithohypha guttulata]|uniref:Metallo-beta-lactamase domain-containing protein n=1 Tax=Lithohypha guttulata TaxID=1690604 RepID=A0AAN7YGK5_9EURO|nr:hypothetical protein LTR05_004526 [Lithohypha guttulata]
MNSINIDCRQQKPPIRTEPPTKALAESLPKATQSHDHPAKPNNNTNASLFFVGTATTILEWEGFRLMTDPNFLHAGDHVHLGPGVTGTRQTNPAVNLEDLPHIDAVLLSHYHADHFDEKVEESLRRDLPIITTPHAKDHLANKGGDSFTNVQALDFWDSLRVNFTTSKQSTDSNLKPQIQITGMPGTHVPPGPLAVANDLLGAVPPTNGWIVELGYTSPSSSDSSSSVDSDKGYRIYISGDTLMFDDIHRIPEKYSSHTGKPIDLMLIHLGGTTIPSPKVPILMVTMDAKQGIEMMRLIGADVTIPIHYDDYDVFLSPLSDFKKAVSEAGLDKKVVYLDRGEEYRFEVKK